MSSRSLRALFLVLLGAGAAQAQEITEFRLGILGGENAQDRMTSNQCFAEKIAEALGVEVKVFTPADYNGVMQGLLGGTIDAAWMGASSWAASRTVPPMSTSMDSVFSISVL